jgi:dihydroneopterin aldolase
MMHRMDRMLLEDMVFYGYHGDLAPERELGARFRVDVALGADLSAAGRSDHLDDTLDYVRAYQAVRDVVEGGERHRLLESLAEAVAQAVLALPRVVEAQVRVRKQPPLGAAAWTFGVEVTRRA